MMIRPYSDPTLFAAGGKCEANQTNFPALAMFWKFDEKSGNTITDSITGVYHTDAANVAYDSTFDGVSCNVAAGTAATSGITPLAGASDILIVGAAVLSSFRSQTVFGFGMGTASGTSARALYATNTTGTSVCSQCDGTAASISTTALSSCLEDVPLGGALAIDRGAILQSRRHPDTTGAVVAQTSAGTASTGSIPDVAASHAIRFSGVMFGYAAFYFASGLPTNWESGAAWMAQQWMNGNKWIYPGFKGLT